jgi:hypothetical protein
MPQNPYLVQRLDGIQKALMAQHVAGTGLPNALTGSERETFLREFLQQVFPAHRRFATGAITDSTGAITGQVDIAVEYGVIPSFPMPSTTERLLLAESVALVIEVKSDLSAQWGQVCETTSRVKALQRHLNAIMTLGDGPPPPTIPCIAVGYTGHSTIKGLSERLATTPESQRPDGALVVQSGCFSGFGLNASGPLGLYALCLVINQLLAEIGFAAPDLASYTRSENSG